MPERVALADILHHAIGPESAGERMFVYLARHQGTEKRNELAGVGGKGLEAVVPDLLAGVSEGYLAGLADQSAHLGLFGLTRMDGG